ncbi:sensor histidine kinase [Cytophaga aurantiaca]|uniref:sensor histidine kinase n=1 Tax=Cytophaga aurantiaca TaxID=29530 RepID=UPI0005269FF3|nr:HAMP domain-containing sensor histidine kinase [Cytophaga aurantiaca]
MKLLDLIRSKIIRRFINLRFLSAQQVSYDEIIRIELLVAMCLVALASGLLYILMGLFLGISFLIILNYLIFFSTVIPIVLLLIKKGYYNQAKLIMMIIGSLFMFIKAASLGRDSGMNLSMLIIVFATFAFYSIDDYKYILLSLSFTSFLIIILEIGDYNLLGNDKATNKFEYEFNYIFTGLFAVLFFYVILRVNQYMNAKLVDLNSKLLYKNNSLKKLNEELDSYVYRTSHDMRSPLTSLMGLIHLVKTEKDLNKIEELAKMQENCVNKLDLHIQQIIHLSKNIKTESQLHPIDFRSMLKDIFEELSFFEHSNNVHKIIRIGGIAQFYSDTYRIQTILSNLISNSFKYYRISNERPTIEIDINISPKSTTIIIKDNGIGIPEEKLVNIFDMFYRASNQSKGSGLGLYIVKEMVEKLNGTISVKSKVNVYTQFLIELPNK